MTFHPSQDENYFRHLIQNGLGGKKIDEREGELITQFIETREIRRRQTPIKPVRMTKLAQAIISFRKFLKRPYYLATIDSLKDAVRELNRSKYSQNSKNDFITIQKSFFSWMIEGGHNKADHKELSGIVPPGASTPEIDEHDLITREDLYAIIKACKNLRDRALIAVLYESAGRVGEVANTRWRDLEYKDNGVVSLTLVDEKMSHRGDDKKKRRIPLLMSTEYLASWRSAYPGTPAGDALIFPDSVDGMPMKYTAILRQVTRAAKRAGLTKRIHPHGFRKSRLTELAREGFTDSAIRAVGWNNQNTKMAEVYIKYGKNALESEFLERAGIKKREEKPKNNQPRQCSYCFAMNSPISEFCHKCGQPLTETAKKERAGIMAAMETEEFTAEDIQKAISILKTLSKKNF